MDAVEKIAEIRAKIDLAKSQGRTPFGVDGHRWRLNDPIGAAELAAVERHYAVRLPEDYRAFLLGVGNGGAGPAYGMFSLEAGIECFREDPPAHCLSDEFPFKAYYNPVEDETLVARQGRGGGGELGEDEFERLLDRMDYGTLVVGHEGCGHMHRMVVTGPARGQVWIDSAGSDKGYLPLGICFVEWYERWIDGVLAGNDGTWWFG